jgi:hypothetical protein
VASDLVMTRSSLHSFVEKVQPADDADGCWIWRGAVGSDGYRRVRRAEVTYAAHRFADTLFKGQPIAAECRLAARAGGRPRACGAPFPGHPEREAGPRHAALPRPQPESNPTPCLGAIARPPSASRPVRTPSRAPVRCRRARTGPSQRTASGRGVSTPNARDKGHEATPAEARGPAPCLTCCAGTARRPRRAWR